MNRYPLAVLIDGENVAASHMPAIMDHARRLGEPTARCVVGDFSANRLSEWADLAPEYAIEPVFQKSGGKGRNSADIALTIRAMDLLAMNVFRSFLLVSSDCDFAPLALRLGRSGVSVYGMGEAKSDSAWRSACTDFIVLPKAPARKAPNLGDSKVTPKRPIAGTKPEFSVSELKQLRNILAKITSPEADVWIGVSQAATTIQGAAKGLADRLGGKGKFLKNLRDTGLIVESGEGSSIKIRLKDSSVVPIRAA